MLFTKATLDGLADRSVTATYRRWTVVRPKVGSRFTTRIGVIEVCGITVVDPAELTEADAQAAGFKDLKTLSSWLDRAPRASRQSRPPRAGIEAERTDRPEGRLYRIDLMLAGPDPRVALRADDELDPAALTVLRKRLDRMLPRRTGRGRAPYSARSPPGPGSCRPCSPTRRERNASTTSPESAG